MTMNHNILRMRTESEVKNGMGEEIPSSARVEEKMRDQELLLLIPVFDTEIDPACVVLLMGSLWLACVIMMRYVPQPFDSI